MKNGLKWIMAMAAMLLVAGCATDLGRDYDQGKVTQFVPGQTTVDQVVATLGQPQERETESDGTLRLHYQYVSGKASVGSYIPGVDLFDHGSTVKGKDSYIYFDKQGKYLRAENNQTNTGA